MMGASLHSGASKEPSIQTLEQLGNIQFVSTCSMFKTLAFQFTPLLISLRYKLRQKLLPAAFQLNNLSHQSFLDV